MTAVRNRWHAACGEVLYVGLNVPTRGSLGAAHEVARLRSRGVVVTAITNSELGPGKIMVGSRTWDLAKQGDVCSFVGSLGLPSEQAQWLVQVLNTVEVGVRDELGSLAVVWARGEHGNRVPNRMILSGHHVSEDRGPYGAGNGQFSWRELAAFSTAFPRSVSQIWHLHVGACYTGGRHLESRYLSIFPQLRTIWAYVGSAPGSASGGAVHQAYWELSTRGDDPYQVPAAAEVLSAKGSRKAEHVRAKVIDDAYHAEAPDGETLKNLTDRFNSCRGQYMAYFEGRVEVTDTESGVLRELKDVLHRIVAHPSPQLSDSDRRYYQSYITAVTRILYYRSKISKAFQSTHAQKINDGYRAFFLEPPNFAVLTRGQALAAIAAFDSKYSEHPREIPMPPAAQELRRLLYDLHWLNAIPDTWI